MRPLNTLGSAWTEPLTAFMAYTVASSVKLSPLALPHMTPRQLWKSYKTASQLRDITTIPSEITQALTLGEVIACHLGRHCDTPTFPEADYMGGVIEHVAANGKRIHGGRMPHNQEEARGMISLLMLCAVGELLQIKHPYAEGYARTFGYRAAREEPTNPLEEVGIMDTPQEQEQGNSPKQPADTQKALTLSTLPKE